HDIGDVGRELDDHRNPGYFHDPTRNLFAVLRHLTHSAAHAAFAHAVRAAIVQFDAVRAGVLNAANDVVPGFPLGLHHRGDDDGTIGPGALHLRNFTKIHFQRAVGDQLNVIDGQHFLAAVVPGAVAIGNVQHRSADGLPYGTAPARFKRAV